MRYTSGKNGYTFFVLNGLVDGAAGVFARTCGFNETMQDGWYHNPEDGSTDDGYGPFLNREAAEEAMRSWITSGATKARAAKLSLTVRRVVRVLHASSNGINAIKLLRELDPTLSLIDSKRLYDYVLDMRNYPDGDY